MDTIRRAIATFSIVAILSSLIVSTAAASFSDVSSGSWYESHVEALAAAGAIDDTSETFSPGEDLTRGEALKWLLTMGDLIINEVDTADFPDVPESHALADEIYSGVAYGIVGGYDDGTFGPDDSITREQFGKMVVETFELPLETTATDFPDNEDISPWAVDYMATVFAYGILEGEGTGEANPGGNINRAAGAKMTHVAVDADLVDDPVDPVDPDEPAGGDVSIEVSDETPEYGVVAGLASNVPYFTFDISAGDEDAEVSEIKLTREGLGHKDDFAAVYLYADGVKVTRSKSVNSDDEVTFALNPDIAVEAGETVTVKVVTDMASLAGTNVLAGNLDRFTVKDAADITLVGGGEVDGDFPLEGEYMGMGSQDVGDINVSLKTISDTTVKVGEKEQIVAKLELVVSSTEDVLIQTLSLKQEGSADPEDMSDFKIYKSSTLLAEVSEVTGDYLTFEDMDLPVEKGDTITLTVKADVDSGSANTIKYTLDEGSDLYAEGATYGYGVDINNGSAGIFATVTCTEVTIEAGEMTLEFDTHPASDISDDVKNVVLAKLKITAGNEEYIYFKKLYAELHVVDGGSSVYAAGTADTRVEYGLENIQLRRESGSLIDATTVTVGTDDDYDDHGTSADNAKGFSSFYFTDFEVEDTETLEVIADTVEARLASGDKFRVAMYAGADATCGAVGTVNCAANDGYGVQAENAAGKAIDTDINPGSLITSNWQTVAEPAATLTQLTLQSGSVVKSTKDVDMLKFQIEANNVEDLHLTQIAFAVEGIITATGLEAATTAGDLEVTNDFTNYTLYSVEGSGSTATYTELQSGVSASNGSTTNDVTVDFTNLMAGDGVTIPQGDTVKFMLRADAASSFVTTVTQKIRVDWATDELTMTKADDSSLLTLAITDTAFEGLRLLTLVNKGYLLVSLDSETPSAKQLLGGTSDYEMLRLKLDATNEDALLMKLVLKNDTSDKAYALSDKSIYGGVFVVDATNNTITIDNDGSAANGNCANTGAGDEIEATITAATYTGATLATELATQINASQAVETWTVVYTEGTGFVITDGDADATNSSVCMAQADTTADTLLVDIAANITATGTSATAIVANIITGTNDALYFNIDDDANNVIDTGVVATLATAEPRTGAELAADINTAVETATAADTITAVYDGGYILITSDANNYTAAIEYYNASSTAGSYVGLTHDQFGSNSDDAIESVDLYKMEEGGDLTFIASQSTVSATGTITFDNLEMLDDQVVIDEDNDLYIYAKVNVAEIGTGSSSTADYNDQLRFIVDNLADQVEARGAQSGEDYSLDENSAWAAGEFRIGTSTLIGDLNGGYFGLKAVMPTVLANAGSDNATLYNGAKEVGRFSVTLPASSNDNAKVDLERLKMTVSVNGGVTVADAYIYRSDEPGTTVTSDTATATTEMLFNDLSSLKDVSPGETVTFIIKGTVAGGGASGDSLQLSINSFGTLATEHTLDFGGGDLIWVDEGSAVHSRPTSYTCPVDASGNDIIDLNMTSYANN
jgi:hypothetical protein